MTYKPNGYNDLSPYLIVDKAPELLDFMRRAFDAKETRLYTDEAGGILHGEVQIGDSVLMFADATQDYPAIQSVLHVYVPDADAAYKRALEAGAESVQAPSEREGDPDRRGTVKDPFGNLWSLGTQITK